MSKTATFSIDLNQAKKFGLLMGQVKEDSSYAEVIGMLSRMLNPYGATIINSEPQGFSYEIIGNDGDVAYAEVGFPDYTSILLQATSKFDELKHSEIKYYENGKRIN